MEEAVQGLNVVSESGPIYPGIYCRDFYHSMAEAAAETPIYYESEAEINYLNPKQVFTWW